MIVQFQHKMKARTPQCYSHSKNGTLCVRAQRGEGLSEKALNQLIPKPVQSQQHRLPEELNDSISLKSLLTTSANYVCVAGQLLSDLPHFKAWVALCLAVDSNVH